MKKKKRAYDTVVDFEFLPVICPVNKTSYYCIDVNQPSDRTGGTANEDEVRGGMVHGSGVHST